MLYEFENIETKEIKEFYFPVEEAPKTGSIIEKDGEKWKRLISKNVMGVVKGTSNPVSSQQFVHDTARQKGTVGDLMDKSAEESAKRAKQSPTGRDPVKDKWFENWSKKRSGKRHPQDDR